MGGLMEVNMADLQLSYEYSETSIRCSIWCAIWYHIIRMYVLCLKRGLYSLEDISTMVNQEAFCTFVLSIKNPLIPSHAVAAQLYRRVLLLFKESEQWKMGVVGKGLFYCLKIQKNPLTGCGWVWQADHYNKKNPSFWICPASSNHRYCIHMYVYTWSPGSPLSPGGPDGPYSTQQQSIIQHCVNTGLFK